MYSLLNKEFKNVAPYCSPVITYPAGYWSWAFCSDDVDVPNFETKLDEERALEIEKLCKIYNSKFHKGVFAVPYFMKELTK
jgi:spermidine synthase